MTLPTQPTICDACSRRETAETCEAFPYGIPGEILLHGFDHRQQLLDESLLFNLEEGAEDVLSTFDTWKVGTTSG
jgi:hypothetical protein